MGLYESYSEAKQNKELLKVNIAHVNGHTAPNLRNKFKFNYEMDCPYNLRNSSTDLALPKSNKDFGKRCFSYSAADLWNKLPLEAKIAPTVWSFKKLIQQE